MLKDYYRLTKPGIVYGNVLTTLAGFLFAARWHIDPLLLFATFAGLALVIASACVLNNYIDRRLDQHMARTKDRALVSGTIPALQALVFCAVLGTAGLVLLVTYVNVLAAALALFGFFFYIGPYSLAKRASHWGTVVGSVSGAVPIVVGYAAVAHTFDTQAAILFIIMALWQMPHFYAIATYRLEEYKAAGVPVLPVQKGILVTKWHIVVYVIAYLLALMSLTYYDFVGYFYLVVAGVPALAWLWLAVQGFRKETSQGIEGDAKWARRVFFCSLIVLLALCAGLALAQW